MKNQTTQNKNVYKDFDINFTRHPLTNDVGVKTDVNAINQSIMNLVSTQFYERPFEPRLGGNLQSILFEHADPITIMDLKSALYEIIGNYEPRVRLVNMQVKDDPDRNAYRITIIYTHASSPAPVSLGVTLERLR